MTDKKSLGSFIKLKRTEKNYSQKDKKAVDKRKIREYNYDKVNSVNLLKL